MLNQIYHLYEKEAEDNKKLKEWVDKLADFILSYYFQMTYIDSEQWQEKKKEIVREICMEKKWE